MKDEIKEILSFKEDADYKKLSVDEIGIIENYITNLKKIIKQRDKDIDTLLKTIKVDNNKITNLQEKNQALKNQLDFIEEQNNIIDKLKKENEIIKSQLNICSQDLYMENLKLKLENERLKEKLEEETLNKEIAQGHRKQVQDIELQERKELKDYKSRCEKARKMIKFIAYNNERPLTITELNKVYNILGGDDND